MNHLQAELKLAKATVTLALERLRGFDVSKSISTFDSNIPKEIKSTVDKILENIIIENLRATKINILSEEAGCLTFSTSNQLRWVVDPLDGTFNYVRALAPCSVSISLCQDNTPIFGVIGEFPSGKLSWGGNGIGSFIDDKKINVSATFERKSAILCSGFPSRFEFDQSGLDWVRNTFKDFGKIRMFGSASMSLLHIARGAADAYAEKDIMIWDVMAGLGILNGAGGTFNLANGLHHNSVNVFASNGLIQEL